MLSLEMTADHSRQQAVTCSSPVTAAVR